MRRLLEGEPRVLRLLASDPFADEPPKQIRAVIYRCEPTTRGEHTETKRWWSRSERMLYAPVLGVPIDAPGADD